MTKWCQCSTQHAKRAVYPQNPIAAKQLSNYYYLHFLWAFVRKILCLAERVSAMHLALLWFDLTIAGSFLVTLSLSLSWSFFLFCVCVCLLLLVDIWPNLVANTFMRWTLVLPKFLSFYIAWLRYLSPSLFIIRTNSRFDFLRDTYLFYFLLLSFSSLARFFQWSF